jgi:hypothetical protein
MTCKRNALVLLAAFLVSATAWADNYFTMGVNDTLRVNPAYISGVRTGLDVPIMAHFDGRLNFWQVTVTPPEDMHITAIGTQPNQCPGLTVEYIQSTGTHTTYTATLGYNLNDSLTASSYINISGYWDYDDNEIFETYGTVKWEAGDYTMFPVTCDFDPTFTGGTVTLRCILSSGYDARGGMVGYGAPVHSLHQVTVIVGYQRGDVNGDGIISALDLTSINNYLLTSSGLDQYQLEAADMNGDGNVSALDMSLLIDLLMTLT